MDKNKVINIIAILFFVVILVNLVLGYVPLWRLYNPARGFFPQYGVFNVLWLFAFLMLLGFIFWFNFSSKFVNYFKKNLVWAYYILLLPAIVFPLVKCWFKIPYVFCHVCPRKCGFGYIRPFAFPIAIGLNLKKRTWCSLLCPLGNVQIRLKSLCKKTITIPKWLIYLKLIVVVLIVPAYFYFSDIFIIDSYKIIGISILLLIVVLLSVIFIRPFCNCVCPIGGIAEMYEKAKKKLNK
jgi:polyferredoxin